MRPTIPIVEINYLQATCDEILSSQDEALISLKLKELVDHYLLVSFSIGHGPHIWRGRKCSKKGFEYIQELSYRIDENVAAGRINHKGSSLFYASYNKFCVFAEIGVEEGDHVHLIGCHIEEREKLNACLVGEALNVYRSGKAFIDANLGTELNKIINKMKSDDVISFIYLDAFFSDILHDKEASRNNYLYSRILGNLLLNKFVNIDSIIYPSAVFEKGVNIAITPSVVDKALASFGTVVVRINKKYKYGLYDFSIIRESRGQDSDGRIQWI